MITTQQCADEIGCHISTVRNVAKHLGIGTLYGARRLLSRREVALLKRAIRRKPGRPCKK